MAEAPGPAAAAGQAPLLIALLGAESTGKTTLAQALAARLAADTGLAVTWVPEWLRTWCEREGRTPQPEEQAAIAEAQHAHIDDAARAHNIVVCDSTALATAVYSRLLFGDDSLLAPALQMQRTISITLLTATDLPWVADGLQRDGEHVRAPVDTLLRELLLRHRLPWAAVSGRGPARLESALDALAPLLRRLAPSGPALRARLQARNASPSAARWTCLHCDDAECEHLLRRLAGG